MDTIKLGKIVKITCEILAGIIIAGIVVLVGLQFI